MGEAMQRTSFETVGSRPRRIGRWWLRTAASTGAVGLVLMLAAGCTSSPTSASSSLAAAAPTEVALAAGTSAAPTAGSAATAAGGQSSTGELPNVSAQVVVADRQAIKTANVTMNVVVTSTNQGAAADLTKEQAAVNDAYVQVTALPSGAGYVSAVNGGGTTVSITLRVPVAGFSDVLDELAGIGPIATRQISTEDVTAQLVDISSRAQTMAASVAQGRALLSKATKIGDVIAIEGEVNQREADLESLQRQQAALAGQTALSTITVVLRGSVTGVKKLVPPPPPVPPAARSGFVGGLANGWHAVRHIGHAVLTVIGTLLPFLPIVAVVVLGFLYRQRKIRRITPPVVATQPGDPHPTD
jgi:hypothetical protein